MDVKLLQHLDFLATRAIVGMPVFDKSDNNRLNVKVEAWKNETEYCNVLGLGLGLFFIYFRSLGDVIQWCGFEKHLYLYFECWWYPEFYLQHTWALNIQLLS